MATLVDEIEPVVAVKVDFACQDKSKVKAYFENFGPSRLWGEEKMNGLICEQISTSFEFLAETTMEDTKPLVTEN